MIIHFFSICFKAEWINKKNQHLSLKLGYNCKIEYLTDRENTYVELLSGILQKLEEESTYHLPEIDDKAEQVNVGNLHRIRYRSDIEEADDALRDSSAQSQLYEVVSEYQTNEEINALKSGTSGRKVVCSLGK